MIKKIKISGLDCPNCAKKLEGKINNLECVKSAKIDFLKSILILEAENFENSFEKVKKFTKEMMPDVELTLDKEKKISKGFITDIITLLLGFALGLVVLLVNLPVWLYWTMFVTSALLMGYKTYYKAFKLLLKKVINENLLVTLSVIGATCVGEHMEGLMVIILYTIGKILEGLAVDKSRKSIEELTNLKPDYAVVLDGEVENKVEPKDVEIDQIMIVRPGERIAVDGIIVEGKANLNLQSLTGESLPESVCEGDEVLSGAIVLDGVLKIKVTKKYSESTVSRILEMIEHAEEKKSKTETVISKVAKWYTLGVIACSIIVFGIVWAVLKDINVAVYRGLIFLVVSCPCAFAISVPLTYFSGIGNASKNGILIKGSNYLDALAKIEMIAFDKTGTLTTGKFKISKVESFEENLTEDDIIYIASLGEQHSLHPLAKSIVENNSKKLENVENLKEIQGEGVYFLHKNDNYFVGRKDKSLNGTVVEVYKNEQKIGQITLKDEVKEQSINACEELSLLGIKVSMLSGDNELVVEDVARELAISDYNAKMLPEDKFNWLEAKKKENVKIGYVGDGINDAPSLRLSDVGISMGINGTPASIEASDVVLVDDNPNKVATAVKISKKTHKIVWENISFSAGIKITFLTLGALGVTGMLSAVIADVGVTLLAIFNSLRALKYKPNKQRRK